MKKNIKWFAAALVALTLGYGAVSCGSDSKEPEWEWPDPDPDPDPRHDHPTPSPDPELPYTGQDWRTVGLLSAGGVILLSLGLFRRRKDHEPSQPE